MKARIGIEFTPNENGFDRFTVTTDNGKPYLENPSAIGTNDPLACISAVAAFLADCEGGQVEMGGIPMNDVPQSDEKYYECPACGSAVPHGMKCHHNL